MHASLLKDIRIAGPWYVDSRLAGGKYDIEAGPDDEGEADGNGLARTRLQPLHDKTLKLIWCPEMHVLQVMQANVTSVPEGEWQGTGQRNGDFFWLGESLLLVRSGLPLAHAIYRCGKLVKLGAPRYGHLVTASTSVREEENIQPLTSETCRRHQMLDISIHFDIPAIYALETAIIEPVVIGLKAGVQYALIINVSRLEQKKDGTESSLIFQEAVTRYRWPLATSKSDIAPDGDSPPFAAEMFWGPIMPLEMGIGYRLRVSVVDDCLTLMGDHRVLATHEVVFDVGKNSGGLPYTHVREPIRSIHEHDTGWLRHAYLSPVLSKTATSSTDKGINGSKIAGASGTGIVDSSRSGQRTVGRSGMVRRTRTAVCVSGQIRSLNLRPSSESWPRGSSRDSTSVQDLRIISLKMRWGSVAENMHRNLFAALDDFDVFFTVSTRGESVSRTESDCDVLRPRKKGSNLFCHIMSNKTELNHHVGHKIWSDYALSLDDDNKNHLEYNLLDQLKGLHQCSVMIRRRMLDQNIDYDYIIRVRPDMAFFEKMPQISQIVLHRSALECAPPFSPIVYQSCTYCLTL